MHVVVEKVSIPAMSTIGYGWGTNDDGERVHFLGDHRPMRDIGEAINGGELAEVELDDWQIVNVDPPAVD